ERIPPWIAERLAEIFIIDDHSSDNTFSVAANVEWPSHNAPLRIFRTPHNQGYGGNQRVGYLYAIGQGFDIFVLLHRDGQNAPEALALFFGPFPRAPRAGFCGPLFKAPHALAHVERL